MRFRSIARTSAASSEGNAIRRSPPFIESREVSGCPLPTSFVMRTTDEGAASGHSASVFSPPLSPASPPPHQVCQTTGVRCHRLPSFAVQSVEFIGI